MQGFGHSCLREVGSQHSSLVNLRDVPSSFTISGRMYPIESLHYNLNLDVLESISIYTTFGGFPVIHCVA